MKNQPLASRSRPSTHFAVIRRQLRRLLLHPIAWFCGLVFLGLAGSGWPQAASPPEWTLVGWNDLGMHCMDGTDFSVFSILPPFNTIHSHLLHNGEIVTGTPGIEVTYEAVPDPDGSENRTSAAKINFWEHMGDMYGFTTAPDVGLFGAAMPGPSNIAQSMHFDATFGWYTGEGIPITPFDDALQTNYYPMMRLKAWNNGVAVASTDVVLPVSDEMDCSVCHQSGSDAAARPAAGWIWHGDSDKDVKLNILRLHDEKQLSNPLFQTALAGQGYWEEGLFATVMQGGTSILCARCHQSNALPPVPGEAGVPPMTQAIHSGHAPVIDPETGMALDASENRGACYRCHPGSDTLCLRGAMGKAVAGDGALAMQCQSCHGNMSNVGAPTRVGWLEQPNCQACHSGTATTNRGKIRYTTVFDTNGAMRVAADLTFATNPGTSASGVLYRFSAGHGGLQCSACHGSPHAIYPSLHRNDNLQNEALQGHAGTLSDCTVCHDQPIQSFNGGPHGMHRTGASWVDAEQGDERDHQKAQETLGLDSCRACHGADLRGTVLSMSLSDQTINTGRYGTKHFWKGFQIGCYNCHNGPGSDDTNSNSPAVVAAVSATTTANVPVSVTLAVTDANASDSHQLRIVEQPDNGRVGLVGNEATYYPFYNFTGVDTFTYAAWDGDTDSNLGVGTVTVLDGSCVLTCAAAAPTTVPVRASVPFWADAELSDCPGSITYQWDFGDGSPLQNSTEVEHIYNATGTYSWTLIASANGLVCTNEGSVQVTDTMLDVDSDGIDDTWETSYFVNLFAANSRSDSDLDGFIDLHEFLAGTIPTNSASLLEVDNMAEASASGVVIHWASASNRVYRVTATTSLTLPDFQTVASGLPATPPMNTYTDVTAVVEFLKVYRVELE